LGGTVVHVVQKKHSFITKLFLDLAFPDAAAVVLAPNF